MGKVLNEEGLRKKQVHDLLSLLFNIPERLRFRFTRKKKGKEVELRHNSMKIKWFFIQFRNELFIYAFIFSLCVFYNIFIIIKTTVIWWKTYLPTHLINIVSDEENKNFWSKTHVNLLSKHILRLKLCKKRSTFSRLCTFYVFSIIQGHVAANLRCMYWISEKVRKGN